MDHPSRYWIKFLCSRGKHTHEMIEGMLTAIDLGGADADFIKSVDDDLDIPEPFMPRDLRHRPSQSFLRREGIYEAWHDTKSFNEAFGVLSATELRHMVETFVLSPLRPDQAVKKIKQKTGIPLSIQAYELYQHYFWNKSLLSGAAWGEFILQRDQAHMEWLQLAVHAKGAQGAQMLMWKMGTAGRLHVESGRMFRDIRDINYMCIKQIEHRFPTIEHSKMMLNYARVCDLSQRQVDASESATEDIVKTFNSFRMKREEVRRTPIQQLTGGNFSEAEDVTASKEGIGDY